jgi:hypothetical protein
VIDIVRDYTAIGLGSAQATTTNVVGAAHSGARWVTSWGQAAPVGDDTDSRSSLLGTVVHAPHALSTHIQGEIDRAVERLGLVREAEVRALRHQVQRLERHIGDLRGDR